MDFGPVCANILQLPETDASKDPTKGGTLSGPAVKHGYQLSGGRDQCIAESDRERVNLIYHECLDFKQARRSDEALVNPMNGL
jgi:hypothetical protein